MARDLPRLLLVAEKFTRPDVAEKVLEAIRFGVPWVQLRDHDATEDDFEVATARLISQMNKHKLRALISINSRIYVAQAHGEALHTGYHGVSVKDAVKKLGPDWLIGASVHSKFEAVDARDDGASYAVFSPVFPTKSKPDHKGWGTEVLHRVAYEAAPMPVVALGGITPERVAPCLRAGAHTVGVYRGILEAPDIRKAVRSYLMAMPGS